MENKYKNLGKVRPTVEGDWDIGKSYKVLSIVFDEASNKSYISIKDVPKGISILNKKYWGRFGNNRIDSDSIVLLSRKDENGDINTYTLEEAINSISIEDRRIGLFISFYEKPIDANSNYRWNMYQFNSNDINDWGNLEAWSSIYYVKTKFFGLQVNEEALYYVRKNPDVGDYAFVGDTLKDAVIYRCYSKNIWKRTKESAVDYLSIVFKGNITIGSNGNWFQDGIDTGIKAQGPQGEKGDSIKGEKGDTPIMRLNREEGYVQFGYDGEHWNNLIPITDFSIIENNPDEEDITSDDNNKLKFADRSYNPDNFSGKGYKILRKNIVDGKNVLTQEMVNEENTVYEIRYDFDLNEQEITIPDSSILYFNSGSLSNGTLTCRQIRSSIDNIFRNVIVNSGVVYLHWFGAYESIAEDATDALQLAVKVNSGEFKKVLIPAGTYYISKSIECIDVGIVGDVSSREGVLLIMKESVNTNMFHICNRPPLQGRWHEFCIENMKILGPSPTVPDSLDRQCTCIYNDDTAKTIRLRVINCNIQRFDKAFYVQCLIDSLIRDTYIGNNCDGFVCYASGDIATSTTFDHCYIQGNKRNVTIERNAMLDIRFTNGTIMEAACFYNIKICGGVLFVLIDQCYFESNSWGYDWNGGTIESDEVKENILWIDADPEEVNEHYCTFVLTNNIIAGSNNWGHLGNVIEANAGTFYFHNNVCTRFSAIFKLIDNYTANRNKFNLSVGSIYFGGSSAKLFTDDSYQLGYNDRADIKYLYGNNVYNTSEPNNLRIDTDSKIQTGFTHEPGVNGELNAMKIKLNNNVLAHFNSNGVSMFGYQEKGSEHIAKANTNSLCIINATKDITNIINHTSETTEHSYITSEVLSSQTHLYTYLYNSIDSKFTKYFIPTFYIYDDIDSLTQVSATNCPYILAYIKNNKFAISCDGKWLDFLGNPISAKTSGTFSEKPNSSTGIKVGFAYFCTDRQTTEGSTDGIMIYHKGEDVWVDALGRVIS